jgi:hypothetical protein
MSWLSDIFGSSKTTTTPEQKSIYTPQQQELLNRLTQQASQGSSQAAPSYPGMTYVPAQPLEQSYMDAVTASTPEREKAFSSLMNATPAYDVSPEATEQYWQKSLLPMYQKTFNETTMPQLTESFTGPSFWSSNRAEQTRKAVEDYGTQLSSAHSELLYKDELARRTAMENAYSRQAGAISSEPFKELGTAGALARTVEQEKVAGELQRWLIGEEVGGQSNQAYNPYVNIALSLLGYSPYTYGENTQTSGGGILSNFIGGAGQGAGQVAGGAFANWLSG